MTVAKRSGRKRKVGSAARSVPRTRLLLLLLATLVGFSALLAKLAMLQAVSPQRYTDLARDQRTVEALLPASRGAILDRNGQPLATSVNQPTVWADPQLVRDPLGVARALAPLLNRDEATLRLQLITVGSRFEYLARQVTRPVAVQVRALALDGVFLIEEPTRFAPAKDLATSVIGLIDIDNRGITGIEQQFNDVLTGEVGKIVQEESRDGHTIPAGQRWEIPAVPGQDVLLTLDRNLQFNVEKSLLQQVNATGARRGTAILGDPRTGEILALASVETPKGKPAQLTNQNLAVSWLFEPGSVMKAVTMAAGIEKLGLTEKSVLHVPGGITIYGEDFVDDHRDAREDLSLTDLVAQSSNVGAILVGQRVGAVNLTAYMQRFGMGEPTGVALPREEPGVLLHPDDDAWSGTTLPTMAIGQGLSVTPMQLFAMFGAIANGGEWVTPSIVSGTIDELGQHHPLPAAKRTRVIAQSTAEQMQRMLGHVVADGTGTEAQIEGYTVGGKTGTAWKVQTDGSYGEDGKRSYTATFAGFVPAEDPQLVAVVVVDEPQGLQYYGGQAAAPVFSAITKPALVSLDISPWPTSHAGTGVGAVAPQSGTAKVRAMAAVAEPTTSTLPSGTTTVITAKSSQPTTTVAEQRRG